MSGPRSTSTVPIGESRRVRVRIPAGITRSSAAGISTSRGTTPAGSDLKTRLATAAVSKAKQVAHKKASQAVENRGSRAGGAGGPDAKKVSPFASKLRKVAGGTSALKALKKSAGKNNGNPTKSSSRAAEQSQLAGADRGPGVGAGPGSDAAETTGVGRAGTKQDVRKGAAAPGKTPGKPTSGGGGGSQSGRSGADPIARNTAGVKERLAAKASQTGGRFASGAAGSDDGSAAGALGKISAEAAKGAAKGAAAGGVGALPGAVLGAAKGVVKSKKGRKVVIAVVGLNVLALLAASFMVIAAFSGGAQARKIQVNEWDKVHQAMVGNGYSQATIASMHEVTGVYGIPFPLLASAAWVRGETLDLSRKELSTPVVASVETTEDLRGVTKTVDGAKHVKMSKPVGSRGDEPTVVEVDLDEPIGQYGFDYEAVVDRFGKKGWTVADLVHPASATELYAQWVSQIASKAKVGDLDLGVGVSSSDTEINPDTGHPRYGFLKSDSVGVRAAAAQRQKWEKVLSFMPVADAERNAEQVYSTALQWYLGESASCNAGAATSTVAGVSGEWFPPVIESAMPSTLQDWGPRPINSGFHDGLDMNLKNGQQGATIYAASAGEVVFAGASVGYGPNWVRIKHPGGIETQYGHMKSMKVKVGDQVVAGQEIGVEGDMGAWSQGDHLHFTIMDEKAPMVPNRGSVDPVKFYAERGVDIFAPPGTAPPALQVDDSPEPPPAGAGAEGQTVRVIQANADSKLSKTAYAKAMATTFASRPDFVSLTDSGNRRQVQYTPAGYDSWRAGQGGEHKQSLDTAVAWRKDRWTKASSGRATLVKKGPRADDNRYANWVTVSSTTLGNVSFVSVQHMVDPTSTGPKRDKRQELYRSGMAALQRLVDQLEKSGPVLVAGDFGVPASANDKWAPTSMMSAAGYQASFSALGKVKPTTKGGAVDYVFADKSKATAQKQWTEEIGGSHKLLGTEWEIAADAVQTTRTLPDALTVASSEGEEITLDSTQLGWAAQVAQIADEVGAGPNGAQIAFMTILAETRFKNFANKKYPATIGKEYPSGAIGKDHYSVGLFQQQPTQGWGPKVVTIAGSNDADFAEDAVHLIDNIDFQIKAFFGGPNGPNGSSPAGLLGQGGWQDLAKGAAAQAVQRSAFPDAYDKWEAAAGEIYSVVSGAVIGSGAGACGTQAAAHFGNVPDSYNLGPVKPRAAALANLLGPMFGITTIGGWRESAVDPGGHPSGNGLDFMVPMTPEGKAQGDALAEYAKANAASLNIDYVIWRQRIWSQARSKEGWRAMSDRGSPTANHMDHPHINVLPE